MAARAAESATLQPACFGRSVAVASVRAMVKQGESETAENDGSELLNVAHLDVSGAVTAWSRLLPCVQAPCAYVFSKEIKKCLRICSANDREGVKISFVLL
jgi:hypothetical protein